MESKDRKLRKNAFNSMYNNYKNSEQSTTEIYLSEVKFENEISKLKELLEETGIFIKDKNQYLNMLNIIKELPAEEILRNIEVFQNTEKLENIDDIIYFEYLDKVILTIILKYCLIVENIFRNQIFKIISEEDLKKNEKIYKYFIKKKKDFLKENKFFESLIYGNMLFNWNQYIAKNIKCLSIFFQENIKDIENIDGKIYSCEDFKEEKNYYEEEKYSSLWNSFQGTNIDWLVFKELNFNDIINLYHELDSKKKNLIKDFYNYNEDEDFEKILKNIKNFRNDVAHNKKIFQKKYKEGISYKEIKSFKILGIDFEFLTKDDLEKKIGDKDLYSIIISIFSLLKNEQYIIFFLVDISTYLNEKNMNELKYLKLPFFRAYNLPDDMAERFEKIYEKCIEQNRELLNNR